VAGFKKSVNEVDNRFVACRRPGLSTAGSRPSRPCPMLRPTQTGMTIITPFLQKEIKKAYIKTRILRSESS
jgi:hypothetical protein